MRPGSFAAAVVIRGAHSRGRLGPGARPATIWSSTSSRISARTPSRGFRRRPVGLATRAAAAAHSSRIGGLDDTSSHVAVNAARLIAAASGRSTANGSSATVWPRLHVPESARTRARRLLGGAERPFVGVHASGGRESKQWHPARFAESLARLAHLRQGTVILTGADADRPLVDEVRRQLAGVAVIDACARSISWSLPR